VLGRENRIVGGTYDPTLAHSSDKIIDVILQ